MGGRHVHQTVAYLCGVVLMSVVCMLTGIDMLEELNSRRRQIHSVAVLAHASADVSNPLLLSATLKVISLSSGTFIMHMPLQRVSYIWSGEARVAMHVPALEWDPR